jgi:tetratricopeptide (TPR) repeat protein
MRTPLICRLVVVAAMTGLIGGASAEDLAQQTRFEMQVTGWTYDVRRHRPGTLDEHATAVALTPWPTLQPILKEVMKRGDPVLLLRGATLLLDVAVHIPLDRRPQIENAGMAAVAQDGRRRGVTSLDSHLWWGRQLVDRTIPDPADLDYADRRAHALAWYRTVTTVLAGANNLADLEPHIKRSLQLFAGDAGVLFDAGCYAETLASPLMQAALLERGGSTPTKPQDLIRTYVRTPPALLAEAEKHFRQAVEREPSHTEARVRLGRVLMLRGRAAAAVVELQHAVRMPATNTVKYYAFLFLADALDKSNDVSGAVEAYGSAAALFPDAQSPYLASSRLAAERGDNVAAQHAVDRVLSNTDEPSERFDPWWIYHRARGRDAASIYQEFAAAIGNLRVGSFDTPGRRQ